MNLVSIKGLFLYNFYLYYVEIIEFTFFLRSISHTMEYADLLDTLNRFNARLAPFLDQYRNFMREDPTVPHEVSII